MNISSSQFVSGKSKTIFLLLAAAGFLIYLLALFFIYFINASSQNALIFQIASIFIVGFPVVYFGGLVYVAVHFFNKPVQENILPKPKIIIENKKANESDAFENAIKEISFDFSDEMLQTQSNSLDSEEISESVAAEVAFTAVSEVVAIKEGRVEAPEVFTGKELVKQELAAPKVLETINAEEKIEEPQVSEVKEIIKEEIETPVVSEVIIGEEKIEESNVSEVTFIVNEELEVEEPILNHLPEENALTLDANEENEIQQESINEELDSMEIELDSTEDYLATNAPVFDVNKFIEVYSQVEKWASAEMAARLNLALQINFTLATRFEKFDVDAYGVKDGITYIIEVKYWPNAISIEKIEHSILEDISMFQKLERSLNRKEPMKFILVLVMENAAAISTEDIFAFAQSQNQEMQLEIFDFDWLKNRHLPCEQNVLI